MSQIAKGDAMVTFELTDRPDRPQLRVFTQRESSWPWANTIISCPVGLALTDIENMAVGMGLVKRLTTGPSAGQLWQSNRGISDVRDITGTLTAVFRLMYGSMDLDDYPSGTGCSVRSGYGDKKHWRSDRDRVLNAVNDVDTVDDAKFAELPEWEIAWFVVRLQREVAKAAEEGDVWDSTITIDLDELRGELARELLKRRPELVQQETSDLV